MNRKKLFLALVVSALLLTAGCAEKSAPTGKELSKDTGQDISNVTVGSSYAYEIKITEKNQMRLVQKRPPFLMKDSLERQNLIRRFKYLNDQNNEHYVYLFSDDGKVIHSFVAQGKVSSVNSRLTNGEQIVANQRCLKKAHTDDLASCYKTVESPQMDGSYGENGDAIFFFTTEGEYVEWNGVYLVSEEPKSVTTAMTLVDAKDIENNNDAPTNSTANNDS